MVRLVILEHRVPKVYKDYRVIRVILAHREKMVILVSQVNRGYTVILVLKVLLENRVLLVILDHKEFKVIWVSQENKGLLDK
jgi:hypothetical protein